MTHDHLMGYAPAMHEDFQAPEWWEQQHRYPLGWPRREMEAACVNETRGWQPEGRYVTGRSSACMTKGDLCGLEPQEGPQEPSGCAREPEMMVILPKAAGVRFTVDLVRRPTLSPAAEWPFDDPDMQERLAKVKAMEHERWLAAEKLRRGTPLRAAAKAVPL